MGIAERRERNRLEIRAKILNAARELFATEGYEAVTMRSIADAIEYSATTIYLHFKDKEALIRELCRVDALALSASLRGVDQTLDPLERLKKLSLAVMGFAIEFPNHYRLMFLRNRRIEPEQLAEMGHGNPELDGYLMLLNAFSEAIRQERLEPKLTDPHLLAQSYWAGVHGVIALHLTLYGDPWVEWRSLEDTVNLTIDTMIRGMKRCVIPEY